MIGILGNTVSNKLICEAFFSYEEAVRYIQKYSVIIEWYKIYHIDSGEIIEEGVGGC